MPQLRKHSGEYPVSVTQFFQEHPNVSFPQEIDFEQFGYSVVYDAPAPQHDSLTHYAVELQPWLTEKNTWEQRWEIREIVRTEEELAAVVADLKKQKLAEILAKSDAKMGELAPGYSASEKLSWPKQEAEAKELLIDENAPAPLLRGISSQRSMPLDTLRDKVLANVHAYEIASGVVIGMQQKFEDMVRAAQTISDVRAIIVDYTI